MYKLKINLFDCTIRIPPETVAALGMPEEVTFLYNRDKAVLAVAAGAVRFEGTGRGLPSEGMGITLKDKWEEEKGCYKIDTALYTMEAFSKALPYNDVRSAFVLSGDFIEKAMIAFELNSDEGESFAIEDLEIFENVAYIMAFHADPTIPGTIEDWIDEFEMFSIYQVLPEILEMWGTNMMTDVASKKNEIPQRGK